MCPSWWFATGTISWAQHNILGQEQDSHRIPLNTAGNLDIFGTWIMVSCQVVEARPVKLGGALFFPTASPLSTVHFFPGACRPPINTLNRFS